MNRQLYDLEDKFAPFAHKMTQAGLPDLAQCAFRRHYEQLVLGHQGYITNAEARPVHDLPVMDELRTYTGDGAKALARAVVIKLNGGLGATMGLAGPKSLLVAKNGYTFLEIIVEQVRRVRQQTGVRLPIIFMNSFHTHAATQAALSAMPDLPYEAPFCFEQHRIPKVWRDDLTPVRWPSDPQKEWCPPGHGDFYLAIQSSGLLERLLARGYEYAIISNADNLGAVVDLEILGYFAARRLTFLMEVTRRTENDRKGGHLAVNAHGHLLLREVAQCPPAELPQFQNIGRYRFFNTNNLWIHLPSLRQILAQNGGILDLPLIRNVKPVDPQQPDSPKVYQLETAIGAAIGLLPNVQAVVTPRPRFLPVKNTNHLLALWSDAYVLGDDFGVIPNPHRNLPGEPIIDLDPRYFRFVEQLRAHFPKGAPSLLRCNRLSIRGNVFVDRTVDLEGDVLIEHLDDDPIYLSSASARSGRARSPSAPDLSTPATQKRAVSTARR
ncbi:MAG: UTP--glucose-1-phosphate uridylyltransferase [Caldilineaceae bacterium]